MSPGFRSCFVSAGALRVNRSSEAALAAAPAAAAVERKGACASLAACIARRSMRRRSAPPPLLLPLLPPPLFALLLRTSRARTKTAASTSVALTIIPGCWSLPKNVYCRHALSHADETTNHGSVRGAGSKLARANSFISCCRFSTSRCCRRSTSVSPSDAESSEAPSPPSESSVRLPSPRELNSSSPYASSSSDERYPPSAALPIFTSSCRYYYE